MPVDKAISWPLSQESRKALKAKALSTRLGAVPIQTQAPVESKAVDQARFLPVTIWSKNEQPRASHAGYGAATGMNGLSTGCSTVFVCKRKGRA
jgi:hypothetical protein